MKFLISVFLVVSMYGKVIDKIDILVNNTPITSYDISKTEKKLGVNKNQAISILIDKAVLMSAIKQRGIYVDDFDIDNEMTKIAQRNGMSLFNFKNYLLQKGELSKLKLQIKENIQKQKLLKTLNVRVTESDVKNFYENHKKQFKISSKISVTQYASINKNDLLSVIKNPLTQNSNVEIKDMNFDIKKANPKLMGFLDKTPINSFSKIINIQGKFVSFYILKKEDKQPLPYKMVEMKIYQQLVNQKSNSALKDFIAKSKAKADITFLQ